MIFSKNNGSNKLKNRQSVGYKSAIILFIAFFSTTNLLLAQIDTSQMVKHSSNFKFNDGFFLNFEQVVRNNPIPKAAIASEFDHRELTFFENVLKLEYITIYDDMGVPKQFALASIWGYARNGALFINWNGEFNRIPVVGAICHFVANKTVYDSRNYDRYYNPYSYTMRQQITPTIELRQYLLDFTAGTVYDYNQVSLEHLIMRDTELYEEYKSLRVKKQRDLKFFYIRKFNERNPIYFPKGN